MILGKTVALQSVPIVEELGILKSNFNLGKKM